MEVIEVIEKEIEVIEVIERGPQGPQGAGITTLTTQGDILYRGATTGERLPIGTTGQILKVSSGGIPEWGAAPSSGVSSVSGTSPIVSSGGSTPAISITAATTSAAGSMSAADKTKLDGIASGAEVNVNADWNASSGDAQILNKPTIPSTAADVGAVPTSRTISAGTGLTGGGDLSANRTLAVSYGTTAGTACQGNDGRIANIKSSSITTVDASEGGSGGTLNLSGWENYNGGSLIMNAEGYGNGGSINTSDGGGSINTRGTGSIELGIAGTRTTLTGTATADRAISLPNAAGTLALTSGYTSGAGALYDYADIPAQSPKIYYDSSASPPWNVTDGQSFREAISCPASGTITNSGLTQATNRILGRTTAGTGAVEELTATQVRTLINVADGATANSSDATLLARANHTGTQGISTITQNTNRILGRTTASTGAVEEITVSGGASLSAGALTVHAQSHAITSTSDHTATANRVFYSNSSGQVTELALGAANTVLTSNGTTSAPTFSALPSGGSKTYFRATALDNQPPASSFATLDTRNSIAVLDFDDASTESAIFVGVMPEGASLGSGLIVYLHFMATTATSGNVRWSVAFERSNTDLDADSFDTATAATVATNGTSGIVTVGSITCTTIDSVTAGDLFRLRVQRLGADAADSMTNDAELVAVEVRSAA